MKKITHLAITLFAGSLCAACATSPESQQSAVQAEKTAPQVEKTTSKVAANTASGDDGSRKVCKRTKVTGSNFKVKTCRTADEWKALREKGQKSTNEFQRRSSQQGNPSGG